jgi:hypothetical protein
MTTVRKRGETTRECLHGGHVVQLRCGHDFFGDAWGSPPFSESTLSAMKEAWGALKDDVIAAHRAHWGDDRPTWAAREFDEA